jgi:hypothetical protein
MSSSEARRARRLARKYPSAPDYILEPETPEEWRSEIAESFASYDEELETARPLIRARIEKLIEACPHEEVKAWARDTVLVYAQRGAWPGGRQP